MLSYKIRRDFFLEFLGGFLEIVSPSIKPVAACLKGASLLAEKHESIERPYATSFVIRLCLCTEAFILALVGSHVGNGVGNLLVNIGT